MIKSSSKQAGSAHVVIIVVLVIALLGALGFVFWNNFVKKSPVATGDTSKSDEAPKAPSPKSGLVVLKDGEMNKYVDYENNFEFSVPKQIFTSKACEELDVKFDNHGNSVPSESHYGASDGPVSVIVFKSGDDYIMAQDKTVVQSDPKGTPETGYIYKSCAVVPTTIDLVTKASEPSQSGVENMVIGRNSFTVKNANDKTAALNGARAIFHDPTGTVNWSADPTNRDREVGDFIYTPEPDRVGGFGYKLWYYAQEKKLVYFALGQSSSFQLPDGSDQYYVPGLENTFKFGVN